MKFKPLHDRVLIEVLDSLEKTSGGIIIPDSAQEKPQEGKNWWKRIQHNERVRHYGYFNRKII